MRAFNKSNKPKHWRKGKWEKGYFASSCSKKLSIKKEFMFSGMCDVWLDRYSAISFKKRKKYLDKV